MGHHAARLPRPAGALALLSGWLQPDGGTGMAAEPTGEAWHALAGEIARLGIAELVALVEPASSARRAQAYKLWLGLNPKAPGAAFAWFNLGAALQPEDPAQAAIAFGNALELKPDLHAARINLGLAREAAGDPAAAVEIWRAGLPAPPELNLLHTHLGRALEQQGALEEAAAHLRSALLIDPDQPDVAQHFLHLRQRMAVWPVVPDDLPGLPPERLERLCGPLGTLAMHDDPALQAEINAAWVARKVPPAPHRLAPAAGYRHDRLRLGYLSSDFCSHAMSYLIAEVLERHDRTQFEVTGYCASPDDGSPIRARVLAALDRHVPVGGLDDHAAAAQIRRDEIDILIDLNGLTRGARLGVLRWRPAPVQLGYLGYIGPVSLPELDGMITDRVAVPEALATAYAPPPVYLEGCFQANDGRALDLPVVSRAEEGLPPQGFVFCSMSRHYKIVPEVFAAWTRIVAACPGAVLWLAEDNAPSHANLRRRWSAAGLDPARLIFAPRVEPGRYRARMALADLYLDTAPYNAGTIASATGWARDPGDYAALRGKCGDGRWVRTLGDCGAFTRRLEALYRSVARTGEGPA